MYKMNKFKTVEFIANYTITKIAEEVGISRPYLCDIISRKVSCSKVCAYALSKFKGKDIDYFFDKED